jgi:hypothetical protein
MDKSKLDTLISNSRELLERYDQPYSSNSTSLEDSTFVEIKNTIIAAEMLKSGELVSFDVKNQKDMQLLRAINRVLESSDTEPQESLPHLESSNSSLETLKQDKLSPSQKLQILFNSK